MRTLSIQNHGGCFIGKLQLQILQAALFKSIDIITLFKEIKNADKNDKGRWQQVIRLSLLQQINIKQRLIITGTLGQDVGVRIGIFIVFHLHLQIIVRVFIIRYDYIKADAAAGVLRLKRLFCLQIVDIRNFYLQQLLQQMLADALARHNLLEDEVALDCQVCKFCCQVLHGFSPFILTQML